MITLLTQGLSMTIKKWKTISRQTILTHPRMKLVEDEVELPDGKRVHYLQHEPGGADSVAVLAVNETGELLLQQEYSYPPDEVLWQLPGGAMNEGEGILEAAKRELGEESGVAAADCKLIGYYYLDNRRSDKKQYVVLATGISTVHAEADPEEFIESHWVSVAEIRRKLAAGEYHNITLLAALQVWFGQMAEGVS